MYGSESNQKKYNINRLLAALPQSAYASLLPDLEIVSLDFKQIIYEPKEQITYVYFPINCLISLFSVMTDGTAAEVGMVGNEGMVGLAVFLESNITPFKAIVQIPGQAMRMKADVFKQVVSQIDSFSSLLHRYTYSLIIQIA